MISWGPGRLDIFVLGNGEGGGDMWHIWADDGVWGVWEFLGSPESAMFALPAEQLQAPTVCSWGPNQLSVFAVGNDRNLWYLEYNNGWATTPGPQGLVFSWVNLGSPSSPAGSTSPPGLYSVPSAVSWGPNRVDIFAMANQSDELTGLWHTWLENGQPAGIWENLGTPVPNQNIGGPPCAVSTGVNQLEVFVTVLSGPELSTGYNTLWCLPYLPTPVVSSSGPPADPSGYKWRGFQLIPDNVPPLYAVDTLAAAITGGPDLVNIFCFGQDDQLFFWKMNWAEAGEPRHGLHPLIEYYAPSWTAVQLPAVPVGGGPAVQPYLPCAVAWGPRRLDVFWPDQGGTVHHLSWDPNTWDVETLPGGVVVQPFSVQAEF
jgi:hypothetical protein